MLNSDEKIELINSRKNMSFIDDPDWRVREAMAKAGEKLDFLINDPVWEVRAAVARCGRPKDLKILINDCAWEVRAEVANHYKNIILANDPAWQVRAALANNCNSYQILDYLLLDISWEVRAAVAKTAKPKYLKALYLDQSAEVRAAVARCGYKHTFFIKDPEWIVRIEVAKQGFDDKLYKDDNWRVRKEVALRSKNVKILEKLTHDSVITVSKFATSNLEVLKRSK